MYNRKFNGLNKNTTQQEPQQETPIGTVPKDLKPGIYQMNKTQQGITLNYECNIIETPELVFGLSKERILRFWKRFCKQDQSLGVASIGNSGSGKTLESDILANLCVLNGEIPVIKITGFIVDEKTVQYIQNLDNVCLYFDEFTKHVNWNSQRLLLPVLTNANKKFFVLITENSKGEISNFILNRTQRVRYIVEHDKLEKEVILDYLTLFDINEQFKIDLLERYDKALNFSFDNLMAIISEHQDYPEESLDEVLKYLNITSIKKAKGHKLTKVTKMEKVDDKIEEINIPIESNYILDKTRLDTNEGIYVYFSNRNPSIQINKDMILENSNNKIIFGNTTYKLEFTYE